MSRGGLRGWVLLLVGAVAVLMLVVALASSRGTPQGSVLSRGPGGWLAARRYLEARGATVTVLREPLHRLDEPGVVVLTFPWQHGTTLEVAFEVEERLNRGHDVVVAYTGSVGNLGELLILNALNVPPLQVRRPSLNPWTFRKQSREEWTLGPAARPLRLWAPRALPELPQDASVLLRSPAGDPVVGSFELGQGDVWVVPVDALSNARLGNRGNADLLETLRGKLGDRWVFDEYHHGLVARPEVEDVAFARSRDLLLIHLAVLYAAALLALSRRMGPPWREPPVVAGSVASFLLGLGRRHDRLGHHGDAARLLLARVRELSPDLAVSEELGGRVERAGRRDLVPLARELARARRGESITTVEERARR